jgi:hypothetical protein
MKLLKFAVVSLALISSLSANASYFRCEGENVVATLDQAPSGLIVRAIDKESAFGSSFRAVAKPESVEYNGSGSLFKDITTVTASSSFGRYEARFNVAAGNFTLKEVATSQILLTESNLKCDYSDID